MGACLSCSESSNQGNNGGKVDYKDVSAAQHCTRTSSDKKSKGPDRKKKKACVKKGGKSPLNSLRPFTFDELAAATLNFKRENLLGRGGFGHVYKGRLNTGQVVAVKQLDRTGLQGEAEYIVEVQMLSKTHHAHLISLIGYCAHADHRLIVYEFMPLGSLEDHLHDLAPNIKPLDWNTRMLIALGAAKGLEYLHNQVRPSVIFRDLKSSNILLEHGYHPRLSDFGLAKLGPVGDKSHVSTRVMGTYGYCAPEYLSSGHLTPRSDVYTFGVVLLEIITGRRAFDKTRVPAEQNLVDWARRLSKNHRIHPRVVDLLLKGHYPVRGLRDALAVADMCLDKRPIKRPVMDVVVKYMKHVASQTYEPNAAPDPTNQVRSSSNSNTPARHMNSREKTNSLKNSPVGPGRARETARNIDVDRKTALAEKYRKRRNESCVSE